jgi:hypothetical protein
MKPEDWDPEDLRTETITFRRGEMPSTHDIVLDRAVLERIRMIQLAEIERARAADSDA